MQSLNELFVALRGSAFRRSFHLGAEERRYLATHGLDGQKGGAARKVDQRIATGVPGDEEVGFPAGSLPSSGLPVRGPRADDTPRTEPEQLALL